jgi:hypothetical protein
MDVGPGPVELRTPVEVRAAGSTTAAAAALEYTTGAVPQQMAALQRSVRAGLFTQVGRRVQLIGVFGIAAARSSVVATVVTGAAPEWCR